MVCSRLPIGAVLAAVWISSAALPAQISLSAAVDLSLRNSPRVKLAQADLRKADASLSEAHDVYIPTLSAGGSGYGRSYGYPQGQPSVLNVQTQSLVFNYSQRDYIRAAHSGLTGAERSLAEAREGVAEDTVLTYLAVVHDEARMAAIEQQRALADRLAVIVAERLKAGQDTAINLTTAQLSVAQLRLSLLHAGDELAGDRLHLAHLTALPPTGLAVAKTPPEMPAMPPSGELPAPTASPGVAAAFANAQAKREIAFGDARYLYRPQISFAAQYSRISTFNNSNYLEYFGRRDAAGNLLPFPANSFGIGVQVSIPFLDYGHRAKERESRADADHAQHDAEQIRDQFAEARLKIQRSTTELEARAEVARLDQQLAQQQLDIVLLQVQSGTGNPDLPPLTPKDEQNARVAEREKYLALLDARFELQQAEVRLLRQTGQLELWLKLPGGSSPAGAPSTLPAVRGDRQPAPSAPSAGNSPTGPPPGL